MNDKRKNRAERLRPMTDDEVMKAALSDQDAQPLSETDFARMKKVPRPKIIRGALGLSQEEFAERYRIPLGTLRDWEQGRSAPDQTARAYLEVIAAEPDAAARAHERAGAA
jgi:putative transcriptional regulator